MHERTATGLLAIQRAVACASPSAFRDAVVAGHDDGATVLLTLEGERVVVLTDAPVHAGEPVALHPVAEVLALGSSWYSARPV